MKDTPFNNLPDGQAALHAINSVQKELYVIRVMSFIWSSFHIIFTQFL